MGAEVILTRSDDTAVSLTERMAFLCDVMPDLSVSVHQNSVDYSVDVHGVRGTLGLWWADSSILLTECVSEKVAQSMFRKELMPRQQKLALCRNPKFPSTLVEVGFMTSVEEYEDMLSGGVQRAARGIAEGVLEFFRRQAQWVQ
jgi:N-acetylmuramoyl-L-alanine amidase